MRSFDCRVSASPVGQDKSAELEVLLEHVGEQIAVLACKLSVYPVVGTHDGSGIGDAEGNVERAKVRLAHRPLIDVRVDRVTSALLVVHGVMLQVANDMLRLNAAD